MKILPFVHASFPLLINGELHIVPLQAFRNSSGMTILRIGDTTIGLTEAGKPDGYEMAVGRLPEHEAMAIAQAASEAHDQGRGKAPASAYYQPGTPGYRAEVAGWPTAPAPAAPPGEQGYQVAIIRTPRPGRGN